MELAELHDLLAAQHGPGRAGLLGASGASPRRGKGPGGGV